MERINYKGFFIDKIDTGYRICKQTNTSIHTHLRNLNPCYKLIDNILNKRLPTRCGLYYIESHIRLADGKYKEKLEDYYKVKLNKDKQKYFNPHKKRI